MDLYLGNPQFLLLDVIFVGCHIHDRCLINVYRMNERKEKDDTGQVSVQIWHISERNFIKRQKSSFL